MENKLSKRIIELDMIRAFAVILMIFDHIAYNIWGLLPNIFATYPRELRNLAITYWNWDLRINFRYVVLFVFLAICGICCSFSRSNLKRGAKLLVVALVLTVGTAIAGNLIGESELMISFGVLHCMSLALILTGLLEKLHCNKWIYLVLGLLMFATGLWIITRPGNGNFVTYDTAPLFELIIKQMLGIVQCGTDCFPFLLFGGQLLIGVFLGKLLYPNRRSLLTKAKYPNNMITFLGRNSLIVYFAHQLILPVILTAILLLMGYQLNF